MESREGDDSSGGGSGRPSSSGGSSTTSPNPNDSGGLMSPPPPPPDFNPPADFPLDSPAASISPPPGSTTNSPTTFSAFSRPYDPPPIAPPSHPQITSPTGLQRPGFPSINRISSDSINTPGSGNSSISSNQSEGGEHLAEAREKLLSESSTSTPALMRSRSNSVSGSGNEGFKMSLISATPPSEPIFRDIDKELGELEALERAGSSRSRRLSSGVLEELENEQDLPIEHAWDSVWPAPGSNHRNAPPEPLPSRFPIAPVSPFVTPSFSPAIIPISNNPANSRKPPSPIINPHDPVSPNRGGSSPIPGGAIPFRFSPRAGPSSPVNETLYHPHEMFQSGRRQSITSDVPLLAHSPPGAGPMSIGLSRHSRSLSNSSASNSIGSNSPQGRLNFEKTQQRISSLNRSPPKSPMKRPTKLSSEVGRPASPVQSSSPPPIPDPELPAAAPPNRPMNTAASPPVSALTKGRPRGHSLSAVMSSQPFALDPPEAGPSDYYKTSPTKSARSPKQDDDPSALGSSSSLPPIALPPPVAPPVPINFDPDTRPEVQTFPPLGHRSPSPPLFAPLARPANLRRALSDYDTKSRSTVPPSFHRTLSITAELDKSPNADKRSSDQSQGSSYHFDSADPTRSPRRSPRALPFSTVPTSSIPDLESEDSSWSSSNRPPVHALQMPETPFWPGANGENAFMDEEDFVDEGDVLPQGETHMDVTFDDEGLNTLERIFLLSKSEYPFHRAYVARVLGDLLNDVDPCESVEYVLPLLSGFSMDDDESVKEAFASELHRILWYFYSTCKLSVDDGEGGVEVIEEPDETVRTLDRPAEPRKETMTITSEGMNVVPKPTPQEIAENAMPIIGSSSSISPLSVGPSSSISSSSSRTRPGSTNFSPAADDSIDVSTPNSSLSTSSQETAYSPGLFIKPHTDDDFGETGYTKDSGILVDRPVLSVSFFTPLVGSLLLNQNPVISESVRNGVVAVLGRLRGHGEITLETWGQAALQPEPDERRSFATQTGPHQHDLRPFTSEAKSVVEHELLQGIIIGMGQLSTEMPELLLEGSDVADEELRDQEAFHLQLVQEATAGRATSMNLIGSVCEFYESEEIVQHGFFDEVLAAGDGDVPVRAEAAVAMSCLAKMAPVEQVYQMLPLFEYFCEDENDHVKQSACLSLPALCRRIESLDYRRSFAIKAVQTLTACTEDVRCAALEMLGEVIHIFHEDPRGPPPELLDVYTDDSEVMDGERDSDWDVVAMFNFPGVCLTLGSDRWSEIRDLFVRLQARAGDKVTRTTASCLHELAKILRPDQVVQDLLPVYRNLLEDTEEIRERIYEHVNVVIASVPQDIGWELFDHLATGWKAGTLGGWRAREKLALHISSFLETFHGGHEVDEVLEMMRDALLDPFAAVRDAATKGIPKAYEVLGSDSKIAKKFRDILLDLGDASSFKQRLTFVRCLREFVKPPPNRSAFEDFFLPVLPRLSQDVVDVRLGLAQIIADLFVVGAYYSEVASNVPRMIERLADALSQDDAVDVRDTVKKVDLERIGKGKGVPYEVQPADRPDRSKKPGDNSTSLSPTISRKPFTGGMEASASSSTGGGAAAAAESARASASAASNASSNESDSEDESSAAKKTPSHRSPSKGRSKFGSTNKELTPTLKSRTKQQEPSTLRSGSGSGTPTKAVSESFDEGSHTSEIHSNSTHPLSSPSITLRRPSDGPSTKVGSSFSQLGALSGSDEGSGDVTPTPYVPKGDEEGEGKEKTRSAVREDPFSVQFGRATEAEE
ncbi:hypothetical protein CI109_102561 [Kwoniella shandongensis]|uniref:Uncharacterized protein n=1 Tax=Kwoniella shandongensis TaxID=1734106 RepID=A0A5M6BUC5_9TREE|nr:uncharacterized protein CI109_005823 [Kwoniella shandongensis]KAA5525801.1 hypothetical protein CI109_005823 [Kwoniella shandongensis]